MSDELTGCMAKIHVWLTSPPLVRSLRFSVEAIQDYLARNETVPDRGDSDLLYRILQHTHSTFPHRQTSLNSHGHLNKHQNSSYVKSVNGEVTGIIQLLMRENDSQGV